MRLWKKLTEEKGASMVEYALLVVLIAIAAIVALAFLGDNIAELFNRLGGGIPGENLPGNGTTAP